MYEDLSEKKSLTDALPALSDEAQKRLHDRTVCELVCTGNFFDGGTFTRKQIAEILLKNEVVPSHTLTEHIAALNAAHAYKFAVAYAAKRTANSLDEKDVKEIHRVLTRDLDDENAGYYRGAGLKFADTERELPTPARVQRLMSDFGMWLYTVHSLHPVAMAAEAHLRLMEIQPFTKSNAAVARTLMNLILLMHGYAPALFLRREKKEYHAALYDALFNNNREDYDKLIARAVKRGFELRKRAAMTDDSDSADADPYFMRIGGLAKESGERVSAIRFWTQAGLLETAGKTSAGYVLYSSEALGQIQRLRKLKDERYTLEEIRKIVQAE